MRRHDAVGPGAASSNIASVAELLDGLPILMEVAFAYDPDLASGRVLVAINNSAALMGPAAVPGLDMI